MTGGPHVIELYDAGARCDPRVCLACAEEAAADDAEAKSLRAEVALLRAALDALAATTGAPR